MRSRISIRGCVRPSVGPSVGLSVRRSVGHTRAETMQKWRFLTKTTISTSENASYAVYPAWLLQIIQFIQYVVIGTNHVQPTQYQQPHVHEHIPNGCQKELTCKWRLREGKQWKDRGYCFEAFFDYAGLPLCRCGWTWLTRVFRLRLGSWDWILRGKNLGGKKKWEIGMEARISFPNGKLLTG